MVVADELEAHLQNRHCLGAGGQLSGYFNLLALEAKLQTALGSSRQSHSTGIAAHSASLVNYNNPPYWQYYL